MPPHTCWEPGLESFCRPGRGTRPVRRRLPSSTPCIPHLLQSLHERPRLLHGPLFPPLPEQGHLTVLALKVLELRCLEPAQDAGVGRPQLRLEQAVGNSTTLYQPSAVRATRVTIAQASRVELRRPQVLGRRAGRPLELALWRGSASCSAPSTWLPGYQIHLAVRNLLRPRRRNAPGLTAPLFAGPF